MYLESIVIVKEIKGREKETGRREEERKEAMHMTHIVPAPDAE